MTDFTEAFEYLIEQRYAGEYSDVLHIEPEAAAAYAAYASLDAREWADWIDRADEAYQGVYGSWADFAEYLANALGLVNSNADWPNNHIDWDAAGRDLATDYFESEGHYFRH